MKAVTLIMIIVGAVALNSCCCQSQAVPQLRPMPKNLLSDVPPQQPTEPVKVLDYKGSK